MAKSTINTTASLKGTQAPEAPAKQDERPAEERRAREAKDKAAAEADARAEALAKTGDARAEAHDDRPTLQVTANPTSRLHFKIFEQQVSIFDADDAGNPDKRLELTFSVDPGDSTKQKLRIKSGDRPAFDIEFPTGGAAAVLSWPQTERARDPRNHVVRDAMEPGEKHEDWLKRTDPEDTRRENGNDPAVTGGVDKVADAGSPAIDPDRKAMVTGETPPPPVQQVDPSVPAGSPFSPEQDTPGNPGAGNTSIDNRTGAQKD
jgi:hypothetical protein